MITPFKRNHIDKRGLIENIQNQIKAGIRGLVFLGTTGEAATLTEEEQEKIIEIGVREAAKRWP